MSKTKSFWDKVCDFCCGSREGERGRDRTYTGREKEDREHKDALPPRDPDQEYNRGQPPGGPRIFKDVEPVVEPLGDDSSSDEEH